MILFKLLWIAILFAVPGKANEAEAPFFVTFELQASHNVRVVDETHPNQLIKEALLPKGTWIEYPRGAPISVWAYQNDNGALTEGQFLSEIRIIKLPSSDGDLGLEGLNSKKLYISVGLAEHTLVADESDWISESGFRIYRSREAVEWALQDNPAANNLIQCVRAELNETELSSRQLEALAVNYSLNLVEAGTTFPDELEFKVEFDEEENLSSTKKVKALRERRCSIEEKMNQIFNPEVITVINYGLSARKKRQFVISVRACGSGAPAVRKMMVAHGANSSLAPWSKEKWKMERATRFSNVDWSKQSSIGYYLTGATYDPANVEKYIKGLSLYGLESTNDLACQRDIIAHGAKYVEPEFIKKEGYVGRSWGCPAVNRDQVYAGLFEEQRGGSLFVILRGSQSEIRD